MDAVVSMRLTRHIRRKALAYSLTFNSLRQYWSHYDERNIKQVQLKGIHEFHIYISTIHIFITNKRFWCRYVTNQQLIIIFSCKIQFFTANKVVYNQCVLKRHYQGTQDVLQGRRLFSLVSGGWEEMLCVASFLSRWTEPQRTLI